ncbi:hypothetical protein C8A05DRAFT_45334 [Staphylotrichum tortipilum]|uniref:Thioredoxin-like fold domain-containing protein n=1 Tax=Staphylotrichum tortipilum TaxID=2831512 RepID=A0AAN6MIR5_9PEZI|nr:hypothetical protein C8A05DRAFT_45334 [Staphylotrichum longicolle]
MLVSPSCSVSWRFGIPRPLQQLFDYFPLRALDPNALPERSQCLTSSDLPTLYVFSTESDARLGLPSFNPGCLKWQTLLRLSSLPFRILPSTNHASPTGALPFLLPPRTTSTSTSSPPPVPASQLLAYAQQHSPSTKDNSNKIDLDPDLGPRAQAYLSLVTLSLRNAWLCALYLDPSHADLLARLYARPASSSRAVQAALLAQLRAAAAEQIVTSTGGMVVTTSAAAGGVDEESVYREAREAMEALAGMVGESGTGWVFGEARPGVFDAGLFSYTHLMMEFMGEGLGRMVSESGKGELARHRGRMLEAAWPGWDGKRPTE